MATIEVDFDVFKALTIRRASESVTYNEVVRDLLGLGVTANPPAVPPVENRLSAAKGVVFKGVEFPDGTQFRATYKGKTYSGEIKSGMWIDAQGRSQSSPSQAAYSITGSGINGWRFWECRRPSDTAWVLIDTLRST